MKFGFGSPPEKNGVARIERIAPAAAIPGGEIAIYGSGFASRTGARPVVHFGEAEAGLVLATDNRVIARVPDGASGGTVRLANAHSESQPHPVSIGMQIADNLHPVANPAVDAEGNIYVTFSGPARSGFALQNHGELQHQAVRDVAGQSVWNGAGPRGQSFRFLPQRRHNSSHYPGWARRAVDRGHGHRHGHRV